MILTFIVFIIWASLEGVKDAFTFSEKWKKVNIHGILLTSRCLVGYLAIDNYMWEIFSEYKFEIITHSILFLATLSFSFPFFQLSAYYMMYQMLGHPHFNFFTTKSPTSNAKVSFTFYQRVILLIISLCLIVYLSLQ
jgi:hypothetical protein